MAGANLGIALGDFNADNDLDAVVLNNTTSQVRILSNSGLGVFTQTSAITVEAGGATIDLALTDIEVDGDIDIAVVHSARSSISTLLNNGAASFGVPKVYRVGRAPQSVAAGDLDGDLDPELITGNRLSNDVSVLYNISFP